MIGTDASNLGLRAHSKCLLIALKSLGGKIPHKLARVQSHQDSSQILSPTDQRTASADSLIHSVYDVVPGQAKGRFVLSVETGGNPWE